jgi:hypothetical protein
MLADRSKTNRVFTDQEEVTGPWWQDRAHTLGAHSVTPRHGLMHHAIPVARGVTVHCGSTVRWNSGAALEEVSPARFSLERAARRI